MTVKVGKHGRNAGWWRVRDAIAAGQRFSNSVGSFRGNPADAPRYALRGQLPYEHWESMHRADYIVWSYETPIAWRTDGTWVTPAVSYSPTTSHHQGQVFAAVSQLS